MKLINLFAPIFVIIALFSSIEAKKSSKKSQITLYTTKRLDSSHLLRLMLVYTDVLFTEVRFRKDSDSQRQLFNGIMDSGFLAPSIPMITDESKKIKYLSTERAISTYLINTYNKRLFPSDFSSQIFAIQFSSLAKSYIENVTKTLETSETLECSALLDFENIRVSLKVFDNLFSSTKYQYMNGKKVSYIDLIVYNVVLFIENVSPGCAIYNFKNLRTHALNVSLIPQINKFENSSYFLSLMLPGDKTFVKRINFAVGIENIKDYTN